MTRKLGWSTALFALASAAWACGSDAPPATSEPSCPAENPECKEIATVEAGARAVERRNCVRCHDGPAGKMAGVTSPLPGYPAGVELYAPNLTNDEETGVGKWHDDQLANAIRTGLDDEGLQLCPQMKHFSEMTDFEVYSIVKYLRSLPAVKNAIPRSVCPPLKTKEEQAAAR